MVGFSNADEFLGRQIFSNFAKLTAFDFNKGKSTIISVFEVVIGIRNIATLRPSLIADSRFELSRFVGKTLLVGKDVPSNYLSDKSVS